LKLEQGELWRRVSEAGVETWICISQNRNSLEELLLRLLREMVER
jgi:hypothetical protein